MGKATKEYRAFHERDVRERRRVRVAALPKVVWSLGELVEIVYKRPDGYEYKHRFKKPRALLCYSPKTRRLYLVGGGYVVKSRGIVN